MAGARPEGRAYARPAYARCGSASDTDAEPHALGSDPLGSVRALIPGPDPRVEPAY